MTAAAPVQAATEPPKARKKAFRHVCPECAVTFIGARDTRFCTTAHKDSFWNREAKRGKVAMPLMRAWRGGRGSGDVARYAFTELCALADRWNAEDRDAGRLSAVEFVRPKMRQGWKAADL
jgi:hypothetical protein